MGSKNRSAARFRICSGHRSDSRAGGSGGWKAAGTNEERKRRAGVHFPGRHLLLASCRSGTRFSGGGEARFLVSCPPPRAAWIPGPAGVAGGKRRGRTRSEKGGRGAFLRQAPPVLAARACGARDAKRHGHRAWAAVCAGERLWGSRRGHGGVGASARGGGAGHSPPRRSGSRFSAGRRGEERARCGPTRLNAIRPALFVRGDSLWIPAATYLPGPSPAKYCRRMRA